VLRGLMGAIGSKRAIFVWTMELVENRSVFECFCPFFYMKAAFGRLFAVKNGQSILESR
jgi:hypothetical protein